jgi:NTP pyrophosphatase (non-canonical NTP hydrolase)
MKTQDYMVSHLIGGLSFKVLREANVDRCQSGKFNHQLEEWSEAQWACALSGEVGELCNLIKKRFRGIPEDVVTQKMLADELADIACYLDLLAAKLGISLDQAVRDKFNEVSIKRGSPIRLLGIGQ